MKILNYLKYGIELINGQDKVRTTLKEITNKSQDYLYIVGGRSRDHDYIRCLNMRLRQGDLEYLRVVTGDHIREPLYNHLVELTEIRKINKNFHYKIIYLEEDKYGGFIVTNDTVFLGLPSSTNSQLITGLVIQNKVIASGFRSHIVSLSLGANEQKDLEFFRSICKEFWPNGVRSTSLDNK